MYGYMYSERGSIEVLTASESGLPGFVTTTPIGYM